MKRKKQKFLSEVEVNKLILYIKKQADRARRRGTSRAVIDELIVLLLLQTGLRPNELCNLKIKDLPISHNEKSIWIRNSKQKISREVMISEELMSLITRFVTVYIENKKPNDTLLKSERGNPFSYFSLYNKVRKIGIDSGIKELTPSILRQTYIIRLFKNEQDLRYVQQQAGYANCRTLHKYIIDNKSELTIICEACGKKIKKSQGKIIESGQFICNKCHKDFFCS